MKIWFLTGEFAPDFGGGIGTYVENCAKMFAEAGDDVTVIVRSINGDKTEKAKEGYRIVRFQQGEGEYYQYLGYDNALAYQYYDVISKMIDKYGKPDILEMQEYNAYGQYIIQSKLMLNEKFKDIPLVVHLHTPSFETLKINQFNTYELPFYWIGEIDFFLETSALLTIFLLKIKFYFRFELHNLKLHNVLAFDAHMCILLRKYAQPKET